jgi:hypothetical protein
MAIDAVTPVFREIAASSAVPQASLTRRDRELQVDEGRPPIEVAETEFEALRRRKREDLKEKWKTRRWERRARREADESRMRDECEVAGADQSEPARTRAESAAESMEEDSTGTLFDDRS